MLAQALDKLVKAIEVGLVLNPELLDQSDERKRAYWRDTLCPALQAAKVAKACEIQRVLTKASKTIDHAAVERPAS